MKALPPGFYKIKHFSVSEKPPTGYYSESQIFEVTEDEGVLEVHIVLYPAL